MNSNVRIINNQVVDTSTGEVLADYDIYVNELGIIKYRAKRKYTKKHNKSVEQIIKNIHTDVMNKQHKPICVYYRTKTYIEAYHLEFKKEYLELIAKLLGYKEYWVEVTFKELSK